MARQRHSSLRPALPAKSMAYSDRLLAFNHQADSDRHVAEVEIKERGLGGLIKSLTVHENGSVRRVELYDAKGAKELVGRQPGSK
jgi:hypothetical protein